MGRRVGNRMLRGFSGKTFWKTEFTKLDGTTVRERREIY